MSNVSDFHLRHFFGSWNGLTLDDNYQAQAIARVMKKFTSQGVEVWLRFAHEGEFQPFSQLARDS